MGNLNYLYIEDDRLSREVMHLLMHDVAGITTYTIFDSSDNFISKVKALPQRPDVFLLDIHVTPLNGFKMLEMIRSDPDYQDSRVIALTASVMNDEVQQLRSSGFDGAIGKPLDATRFSSLIERIETGDAVWEIT